MFKKKPLVVGWVAGSCLILLSSCTPKATVQPSSEPGWEEANPRAIQELIDGKYSEGLWNVGTAEGPNEGVAIRKATMQARGELARQYRSKIDVLQKSYEETANKELVDEYNQVLEILSTLRLQGSIPVKELVQKKADGTYTAKVLVVVSANDVVAQIKEKARAFTSLKTIQEFKTLEEKAAKEQEWIEMHEQDR